MHGASPARARRAAKGGGDLGRRRTHRRAHRAPALDVAALRAAWEQVLDEEGMPAEPSPIKALYKLAPGSLERSEVAHAVAQLRVEAETAAELLDEAQEVLWGRHPAGVLTRREFRVWELYLDGLGVPAIAVKLRISARRARETIARIKARFGLLRHRLHFGTNGA